MAQVSITATFTTLKTDDGKWGVAVQLADMRPLTIDGFDTDSEAQNFCAQISDGWLKVLRAKLDDHIHGDSKSWWPPAQA